MSKRKPKWADREKVVLLEESEKRKVILKAKFSSSITSGDTNRAWQEIANIVNAWNSVKRYIKEIHKKNGTIYVLPQKLKFLPTLEFIIHKLPLRRGNYRGLFRGPGYTYLVSPEVLTQISIPVIKSIK